MFGGWTMERNVSRFCDTNDNPNGVTASDLYQGNTVSRGGRFCDQSKYDVPFRQEFKLSGNYPLPGGVDFAAVLQAYPGLPRTITWQPAASLFPGGRTNAETIILNEPGSLYLPRCTQLDINFRKIFRRGGSGIASSSICSTRSTAMPSGATNNAIGGVARPADVGFCRGGSRGSRSRCSGKTCGWTGGGEASARPPFAARSLSSPSLDSPQDRPLTRIRILQASRLLRTLRHDSPTHSDRSWTHVREPRIAYR